MADIKVKEGDRVIVYRNMPDLPDYLGAVDNGFEGIVDKVGGNSRGRYGMWARIINASGEYKYVKLTYLKHA